MKRVITLLLFPALTMSTFAQDSVSVAVNTSSAAGVNVDTSAKMEMKSFKSMKDDTEYPTPYKMSFKVDGPIIGGGIALTALGTYLIGQKKDLTDAQVAQRTRDKVPFFDRSSAGFYSEKADKDSYIPFQYSFAMPIVLMLANNNERHHAVQVLSMYVETMAVTGTIFTMATGTVYRSRPYVYLPSKGPDYPDLERRKDKDSQRAFFAGHTAATAGATFLAAKVFQDFNPESKWKPVVWGVAAAVPAVVGYLRYKAGMHFLSDNILGYAVGASAGIFVPQLHKIKKLKNLSIAPEIGTSHQGMSLVYKL